MDATPASQLPPLFAPVVGFILSMPTGRVDRSWPVRTNGSDHAPHSLWRYVFAIGANGSAARLSGGESAAAKGLLHTVAGGLFGVAGLMQLSQLTQAIHGRDRSRIGYYRRRRDRAGPA